MAGRPILTPFNFSIMIPFTYLGPQASSRHPPCLPSFVNAGVRLRPPKQPHYQYWEEPITHISHRQAEFGSFTLYRMGSEAAQNTGDMTIWKNTERQPETFRPHGTGPGPAGRRVCHDPLSGFVGRPGRWSAAGLSQVRPAGAGILIWGLDNYGWPGVVFRRLEERPNRDTVAQAGSTGCPEAPAPVTRAGCMTCGVAFRKGLWRTRRCSFAENGVGGNIVRAEPARVFPGRARENTKEHGRCRPWNGKWSLWWWQPSSA
jgi:hypothetical protein